MSALSEPEATGQNLVSLNPIPWSWYLGALAVIIGACITLVIGRGWAAGAITSVIITPLALLLLGGLAALADHSRQKIHGAGMDSDRARLLSNLVQPLLAKFLFLTSTVIIASRLGSTFGLGPPAWWLWGMRALIIVFMILGFKQYATTLKQVDSTYPPGRKDRVFKLGIFYFNPDDDDIIINSGGINIPNFGNKYFWVLVAVLLGFIIFITALASLAE